MAVLLLTPTRVYTDTKGLPFGVASTPALFQQIMHGATAKRSQYTYRREQHLATLEWVLEILEQHGLQASVGLWSEWLIIVPGLDPGGGGGGAGGAHPPPPFNRNSI